jgi:hypothetical protein
MRVKIEFNCPLQHTAVKRARAQSHERLPSLSGYLAPSILLIRLLPSQFISGSIQSMRFEIAPFYGVRAFTKIPLACNSVQWSTVTVVFMATMAMLNL